jgi:hypothetical protein
LGSGSLAPIGGQTQKLKGLEEEAANIRDVADAFRATDRGEVFVYPSATRRPLEIDLQEMALKDVNAIERGDILTTEVETSLPQTCQ